VTLTCLADFTRWLPSK